MTIESQFPDSGITTADSDATLSIGDLAERTGLGAATLRMWESRHGFPVPHRLESGHRRYRDEDVDAILAVLRHKDAGTRLELAIANAMADAEPAAPSIYAFLRRRHPGLGVHRLKKSTLIALSWAIEDEFCAKADRAAIYASFQRERYFRSARPRWTELARVARKATVFAAFTESDLKARPVQIALSVDAPMRREWAVVCDSRELPVVLAAWELPGQDDVPEPQRLFEAMWSVDGKAVHDAARVCEAVARQHLVDRPAEGQRGADSRPGSEADPDTDTDTEPDADPDPRLSRPHTPDLASVTALFNRMVAYVDRIGV